MHVWIRTFTYDVRVQSLYVNTKGFQPREGRRIYTQRKNSERMASLIGSKLAKISWKLDRVEKNRYNLAFSSQNQLQCQLGQSIAGLLACVLYLVSEWDWFWTKSAQIYLILARTHRKIFQTMRFSESYEWSMLKIMLHIVGYGKRNNNKKMGMSFPLI